ncbi:hypothetical protein GRI89_03860 [Altererythrobacter salegens]|uniref:Activator of Hsp90 ATPase homologue 1/2-like C-terminal domain-containing protein n=1 Tax=Croceibacterium salegens TaxID=1737568 RepID=A0A6I4SUA7_9SPHN|nr:SRPBCC domain-containing protein [Croceibacterium salegens]MXO58677.1 hypothetical protein [Croceibacterium salegens]
MTDSTAVHDTFEIRKKVARDPKAAFEHFSRPEKKARWYAYTGTHQVKTYTLDFRVGGEESLVAIMPEGTPIAGAELHWSSRIARIDPVQRIVFFQTLDLNGNRISAALVTISFEENASGCEIVLVHQASYFEGADGPEMRRMGWEQLIEAAASAVEEQ